MITDTYAFPFPPNLKKIAQKIYRIVREKHWMNIYDYIFTHNRKLIEKMNINMEANKK